jgi:hypothetical protein
MDEKTLANALSTALAPLMNGQSGGYAYGQKATGSPYTGPYLYDAGGLFGRCDGTDALINALVGPIGFERVLEWIGTDTEREFVDAWTDIVIASGDEQATPCGDCKTASMKACSQLYSFGRFCRQTQELQFDRLGMRANAGVPMKNLFGAITGPMGETVLAQGSRITDDFLIQTALVGYALRLKNAQMLWNGNSVNNSGAYAEFNGFQTLVNTGKYDGYTQLACNALDSFLLNFANNNPTADGTYAIRQWFHRMVSQFRIRANAAGLDWDTATMYIVMTPNLWDCVARVWSCAGVDLCAVSGQNRVVVNGDQAQARYENTINRMVLSIDGKEYPVVLDNQIPETTGQANGICSDIYFITTDISGRTITYGQYQNFNQTYGRIRNEFVSMYGSDDIALTDNGRYALIRSNSRGCFDIQAVVRNRIVLEMPQLTGRIRNVCCNVLGEPFPDPSGSGRVYAKGGGRTTTPVSTLYG